MKALITVKDQLNALQFETFKKEQLKDFYNHIIQPHSVSRYDLDLQLKL